MEQIGPVDYAIIAFPGSEFTGELAPALAELVEAGTIRIIDTVFVQKTLEGDVIAIEMAELDPHVAAAFARAGFEVSGLFGEEDLLATGEQLAPGSSAVLLVWENVWERKVADAVRHANGELLDFGRIPDEIVHSAREWARENFADDA